MTSQQKMSLLLDAYVFRSERLHRALIRELKAQQDDWETLLARRRQITTYDKVSPSGRAHYSPRRPEDADADHADDIYGVLSSGFTGLSRFYDRDDLPFIGESALWGLKYRFKQLDDAALEAFRNMPDPANLPVIESIWNEFSQEPMQGNELLPYEVIQALDAHRFPDAIPLMAQFADAGFGQEMAQQFLVEMTGADFGNNTKGWLVWYDSHKAALGIRR
jgi:hypothetical protein